MNISHAALNGFVVFTERRSGICDRNRLMLRSWRRFVLDRDWSGRLDGNSALVDRKTSARLFIQSVRHVECIRNVRTGNQLRIRLESDWLERRSALRRSGLPPDFKKILG